jgi:hypothetical protein
MTGDLPVESAKPMEAPMIQVLPLMLLIGLLAVPASADTATPMLPTPQQVAPHSWAWVGP